MFSMNHHLDQLREFQEALYTKTRAVIGEEFALRHKPNQEFVEGYRGTGVPEQTALLRSQLVFEESRELIEALLAKDKEQVLKELCDVLYVTLAIAVLYDLNVGAALNRVHANNMKKMEKGEINGSGKLLKPQGHPKVNLSDLVDG